MSGILTKGLCQPLEGLGGLVRDRGPPRGGVLEVLLLLIRGENVVGETGTAGGGEEGSTGGREGLVVARSERGGGEGRSVDQDGGVVEVQDGDPGLLGFIGFVSLGKSPQLCQEGEGTLLAVK